MRRIILVLFLAASCWGCSVHGFLNSSTFPDAEALVKEKKYQEALAVYERTAKQASGTDRGGSALFSSAEIRVWYDNPNRDYTVSLQKFDEFLRQYPEHHKVREAQNWRHIIKTLLELKKENEQLIKNIEQLKRVDIRHEERRTSK